MFQDWVTALLLAFGIAVGIIGVVAYLRLFRKEKLNSAPRSKADVPPPASISTDKDEGDERKEADPEHVRRKD